MLLGLTCPTYEGNSTTVLGREGHSHQKGVWNATILDQYQFRTIFQAQVYNKKFIAQRMHAGLISNPVDPNSNPV